MENLNCGWFVDLANEWWIVCSTGSSLCGMEESKKPRRRKFLKTRTIEEFESYGGHMFKKWWTSPGGLALSWLWTFAIRAAQVDKINHWMRRSMWPSKLAPPHEDHDHRVDGYLLPPRFSSPVICSDCNHADWRAKRQHVCLLVLRSVRQSCASS